MLIYTFGATIFLIIIWNGVSCFYNPRWLITKKLYQYYLFIKDSLKIKKNKHLLQRLFKGNPKAFCFTVKQELR